MASTQPSDQNATGRSFTVDISRPPPTCVEEADDPTPADNIRYQNDSDNAAGAPLASGTANVGQKKKKKKSKSKKNKISGFEENYADAPMTPEEHEEEVNHLYASSVPFAERIQTCIQRYSTKRRFDNVRKDIFDKYLALGGIITGQNPFSGGLDRQTLESRSAREIADMTATNYVLADKNDAGKEGSPWVIDFEAVARCFFSSVAPDTMDIYSPEKIKNITNVIFNFLNYVLHHNVCPEYQDQVTAARAICKRAEFELNEMNKLSPLLPGSFNVACSTLFGGYHKGLHSGGQDWTLPRDTQAAISDKQARQTIKSALAAWGTEEQIQQVVGGATIEVISSHKASFEVTEILPPSQEVRDLYETSLGGALKTLGKLKAKTWTSPYEQDDEDLTDEEDAPAPEIINYEFLIDEDVLTHCFLGLKLAAEVRELNIGAQYFDLATGVNCSFFLNLENQLMAGWKEPKPVGAEEEKEETAKPGQMGEPGEMREPGEMGEPGPEDGDSDEPEMMEW